MADREEQIQAEEAAAENRFEETAEEARNILAEAPERYETQVKKSADKPDKTPDAPRDESGNRSSP